MTSPRVREIVESAITEALSELDKLGQPHRVGCNLAAAFGFLKAEWEKEPSLEAEAAAMRETLQQIATMSDDLYSFETAKATLDSTTAGQALLDRIKAMEELVAKVVPLVQPTIAHLCDYDWNKGGNSDSNADDGRRSTIKGWRELDAVLGIKAERYPDPQAETAR